MNERALMSPIAATVGLLVPLAVLDRRMQAAGGTRIIPFELAGPDRSAEILRSWGVEGRRAARASLVLDFPFLVAYTVLNVRLTSRAGATLEGHDVAVVRHLAPVVVVVQVVAGACDAVENGALLGVVARGGDKRLASVARTAALAKFAGLAAGWLYGLGAITWRWRHSRDHPQA